MLEALLEVSARRQEHGAVGEERECLGDVLLAKRGRQVGADLKLGTRGPGLRRGDPASQPDYARAREE
jgi:hypothetical protein